MLKTFQAWNNAGYRVMLGSHHVARDENNKPLFSDKQVYIPRDRYADVDMEEDSDFAQAYGLPWGLD